MQEEISEKGMITEVKERGRERNRIKGIKLERKKMKERSREGEKCDKTRREQRREKKGNMLNRRKMEKE